MSLDHAALVTAAAIGTRTRHLDLTDLPAEVARVVPPATGPGDAAPFLAAAAGYAVARRSRVPTATGVVPLAPPAAETRPLAPPAVQALLPRTVDTVPVLLEVLAAVAGAGHRIPAAVVPVLLSRGPQVRAATVPVMGEVGRWLCELNPQWTPLLSATAPAEGSATGTGPTAEQVTAALAALASPDVTLAQQLEALPTPWPRDLAVAVAGWLLASLSPPTAGVPRQPPPLAVWDRWAVAVPRTDAREAAVAVQNAVGAAGHRTGLSTAILRAHRVIHLLTLRSILSEEYP